MEVDFEQVDNLFLRRLFHRAEKPIAGVVYHDVEPAVQSVGLGDRGTDRRRIGHFQRQKVDIARVPTERGLPVPGSTDDDVTVSEGVLGQNLAETARYTSNEPDFLISHDFSPFALPAHVG